MATVETLGVVVAAYGAGLSTCVAVRHSIRDRPRLRLKSTFEHGFGGSEDAFEISVLNVGLHAITMDWLGLEGEDGRRVLIAALTTYADFPKRVEPGYDFAMRFDLRGAMGAARRNVMLVPIAIDNEGRVYRGQRLPLPRRWRDFQAFQSGYFGTEKVALGERRRALRRRRFGTWGPHARLISRGRRLPT